MHLYNLRLPLLILASVSCCCASPLMPPKISGVKGKYVNFTLTGPATFSTIAWSYLSSTGETIKVFTLKGATQTIPPAYTGRVTFNQSQNSATLQLGPLTAADSGVYTFVMVDADLAITNGQTILEVLDPVTGVTITSSITEAVELNNTVVLSCVATGSFLSYQWLNGSSPVVADGKHIAVNGSQLVITQVLRMDLLGPIYCTAQNKLESMTSSAFNLTVNYGPDSIVMFQVPPDTVLVAGSNLTLSCSAVSSPAAVLKWLFNGAELPQKTSTFTLANLLENQSGNYSCVAYNSKTQRYAFSQVATISVIEAISGTNITGPTSLLIAGNSTANLTCKSSVGKADSVLWLKDGQPLNFNERLTSTADLSTISIVPVRKQDRGEYTCQLSNQVSSDFSRYYVIINYGPEKTAIEGPKKVEVVDSVVMKCLVASFPPATYIWKFNGSVLEITTAEYKIEKPDYTNSGIYTCEAYNPVTQLRQTATHSLLVKGEGELNDQLSNGAIAGIIIVVLLFLAIIICIIIRKRRKPRDVPSPY